MPFRVLRVIDLSGTSDHRDWHKLCRQTGHRLIEHRNATDGKLGASATDTVIIVSGLHNGDSCIQLGRDLRRAFPTIHLVLVAAASSENLAIGALKAGFTDYLLPNCTLQELIQAARDMNAPAETIRATDQQEDQTIIGSSAIIQSIRLLLQKLADVDVNTLINGETGTGKELAARYLHEHSSRAQRRFVCVNCAALPETLIESELFGYHKGAFTGAHARNAGKLEAADGGTLFLDEIGDLSLTAQAKILRVIENREVQPLGATRPLAVDVRFVAATHRDLASMVRAGTFREDLFYRLRVAAIHMPALRERLEDISPLAEHLLQQVTKRFKIPERHFSSEAICVLSAYDWPGNVRELRNVIEMAAVNSENSVINACDLPSFVVGDGHNAIPTRDERTKLIETLRSVKWNKTQAAHRLHWSRMTLYRKLAYHQISMARDRQKMSHEIQSDTLM